LGINFINKIKEKMKYSKEIIDKICKYLEDGAKRTIVCRAVGISYDTFCEWMKKPEFSERIKKSEEIGLQTIEGRCLNDILKAQQWQARAWLLERLMPEKYALRQRHDIVASGNGITIIVGDEKTKKNVEKLLGKNVELKNKNENK